MRGLDEPYLLVVMPDGPEIERQTVVVAMLSRAPSRATCGINLRMTLRHAAVLALVGWALMVPPLIDSSGVATQEPLSKWTSLGTFDSAEDCDRGRIDEMTRRERAAEKGEEGQSDRERIHEMTRRERGAEKGEQAETINQSLLAIQNAECIATDDPRLREKPEQKTR